MPRWRSWKSRWTTDASEFRREIERWGLRLDVVNVAPGWVYGPGNVWHWQKRMAGHYPARRVALRDKVVIRRHGPNP